MRSLFLILLLTLGVSRAQAESLVISAASSLTNALQEVGQAFMREHPTTHIEFNWGGSGALSQQIRAGAPVDVLVSASDKVMDKLQTESLIDPASRAVLVHNQLVLIVPRGSSQPIHDFTDLARLTKISIGDPRFVPAGQYATEVLAFYDLQQRVKSHLIFAANVRQVLTYVAQQEVEAGVVYKTDAMEMAQNVSVVAVAPEDSHSPIVYPAAIIKGSQHTALAEQFLTFCGSVQAKTIFTRYGFQLP
ncbi:MAG: molybdate ABC transporter substrate-binding protein [Ferrovum sp. 37-45-19]|jgi:molybdate transport system substrate-binding protein|nr:MAG: molybdate ABC transporter substrate-binding protein [Ferrovum sp. 21-44-67]OYV94225.1 MAG: molybdate ABC transporter substrate-binding protein [Ferrovum sp. 37-45-19]OZB31743.1 MAG: molybdate ABC transporter substrate-binding protein [Ferrovum sp. 34-44-207]HQT81699.1 molybdate ABC transporter substrate-binding protein [Ferrovaceae bacterium]HQU07001.1 molybdate ABC transporter substrate-binding protein [Ferrovaceae bacterium]